MEIYDPFHEHALLPDLVKIAEAILKAAEHAPRRFFSIDYTALGVAQEYHLEVITWAIWLVRQSRLPAEKRFKVTPKMMKCHRGDAIIGQPDPERCLQCTMVGIYDAEHVRPYDYGLKDGRIILMVKGLAKA